MSEHKETDELSGVETTGHEWDGIKELNNPLPRWWLWMFILCTLWAIGYWFVYPAWPTGSEDNARGGTKGMFGWTQYSQLAEQQKEITDRRAQYLDRFENASFEETSNDAELLAFAQAGGSIAFKDNCATCHGTGGAGAPGYPNLNDDDWIWGGTYEDIYQTVQYGIRIHEDGRASEMPNYGEFMDQEEIVAVSQYVIDLGAGKATKLNEDLSDEAYDALDQGAMVYFDNCAACHDYNGQGMRSVGAPNLVDAIWLKSDDGSLDAIKRQVRNPKHGRMPAFAERLDDTTIRQLAVYVHNLGGGE